MRVLQSLPQLLLLAVGVAHAASSWGFDEASVTVKSKQGNDVTEQLSAKSPLKNTLALEAGDSIKVSLTTKDNGKAKRPHQAFVLLKEPETGVEAPFALSIKESGKASVEIPRKDLPVQLLRSTKPLHASIVIGSFGSAQGIVAPLFDLEIKSDLGSSLPPYEAPLRYGKLPEIHHIFRADPRSPPKIISLVFAAAVVATVPAVFVVWLYFGANVDHFGKALSAAPLSHATFFGSIVAMEGVFFLYYSSWNLFQTLPAVVVVGAVSFLSGTKALGEVQSRRLAGER